jgi:hypothetical protein
MTDTDRTGPNLDPRDVRNLPVTITPVHDIDQYIDDLRESGARGVWVGKGAAKLGLSGEADLNVMRALGSLPEGDVTTEQIREAVGSAAPEAVWPVALPDPGPSAAIGADGHVDPAAAARWHQAQTELAGLIREENRTAGLDQPEADRKELLPDSLGDWMARRVCELEEAEADQPEAEL